MIIRDIRKPLIVVIFLIFYFFFYTKSSILFLFYSISYPLIYTTTRMYENMGNFFLSKREASLLVKKNSILEEVNRKLLVRNEILLSDIKRYQNMQKMLNYVNRSDSVYIGSFNVLSFYTKFDNYFFLLNAGIKDDVKENDYVIYNGFLMGIVRKVNHNISLVESIFNEGITIDGVIFHRMESSTISIREYEILGLCSRHRETPSFTFLSPTTFEFKDDIERRLILSQGLSELIGGEFIIGYLDHLIKKEVNKYVYSIRIPYKFHEIKQLSIFRKIR